jgi:uncharacterized membrane protein (UPF0136 family)
LSDPARISDPIHGGGRDVAFQVTVLLVGLIVGWTRKGSLWSIVNVKVRLVWFLPVAYVLQHIAIVYTRGSLYETLVVGSYLLLGFFCIRNLKIPGVLWMIGGVLSNFIVMLANGLRMPAYIPAVKKLAPSLIPDLIKGDYGKSIAMSSHTHLNFLGDIFTYNISPVSLISIGDIVFGIGMVIFVQYAMTTERRQSANALMAENS